MHVIGFTSLPGSGVFSGAENHVFELCRALCSTDASVTLVPLVFAESAELQRRLSELAKANVSIRPVRVTRSTIRGLGLLRGVRRLRKLLAGFDDAIIHAHLDPAVIYCTLACLRLPKARLLVSYHNDDPHYQKLQWKLFFRFVRAVAPQAIAISDAVKEYLVSVLSYAREDVSVVRYGFQFTGDLLSRGEARRLLGLPQDDTKVIGFVGRLTPQKNLFVLIEAMNSLRDYTCAIVGGGEEMVALRERVEELGLPNVHFAGQVPEAGKLFRAFDIFCLPSLWEGFGVVLIEAMYAGVPIVGADSGAIPEVLACGQQGWLFAPRSAPALVEAVRRCEASIGLGSVPAEWRECAVRAFSVERMVRETCDVYASVQEHCSN